MVTRQLLYTARRIVNATEIHVNTPGFATSGNPTETVTANPVQGYQIVSSALLAARLAIDLAAEQRITKSRRRWLNSANMRYAG